MATPKAKQRKRFTAYICLRMFVVIGGSLFVITGLLWQFFSFFLSAKTAMSQLHTATNTEQQDHLSTRSSWQRLSSSLSGGSNIRGNNVKNIDKEIDYSRRIAFFLPFIGQGLHQIPSYLQMFCFGAAGAANVADFYLIHNGFLSDYQGECPQNVIFVNLGSTEALAQQFAKVVDYKLDNNNNKDNNNLQNNENNKGHNQLSSESMKVLVNILSYLFDHNPYALVEFKPALGYIFASNKEPNFLQHTYSHWGYTDLDVLFGDLERWITDDEWQDYDIVTYTFGDQHRLYIRGQFTIHKNNDKVNNIWRACKHLSDLDLRFANVIDKHEGLKFESAEGCYSEAILSRSDLSVKYAPKAWSDVRSSDTVYSQGLYITRTLPTTPSSNYNQFSQYQSRHVLYKSTHSNNGKMLANLTSTPPYWFDGPDHVYSDNSIPLHKIIDDSLVELSVPNNPKAHCMYWAQPTYQTKLCLDEKDVDDQHNIIWKDGKLYKQSIERQTLDSQVLTAPLFHFQEWKRSFRSSQLATMHLSSPSASYIILSSGVLPLYPRNKQLVLNSLPSPLNLPPWQWKGRLGSEAVREQLPNQYYCLFTVIEQRPDRPACKNTITWQDNDAVEFVSTAPGWIAIDVEKDVTLLLTLEITNMQAENAALLKVAVDQLLENLQRWHGAPSIVLVYAARNNPKALAYVRQRMQDLSSTLDNTLVAFVTMTGDKSNEVDFISRRALLNMAMDATPTRWFVSGLEIERGLTLSTESVYFVHQAIESRRQSPNIGGHVYWLPQFALTQGTLDVTLSELFALHKQGHVHMPEHFKEACDEPEGEHVNATDGLWWEYTEELLDLSQSPIDQNSIISRARELANLDEWLVRIMIDDTDNLETIYYLDEFPILLTDNMGPVDGARTTELVREAEELSGKRCYNGMRIGQFAAMGYRYDVVPGAFAVATPTSSHQLLNSIAPVNDTATPSRCRGCYVYRGHYLIADDIADLDTMRAVKTRLVWAEDANANLVWK